MRGWIFNYHCTANIKGRFGTRVMKGDGPGCPIKMTQGIIRQDQFPKVTPIAYECKDCGVRVTKDKDGGPKRRYPIKAKPELPYTDFKPTESNDDSRREIQKTTD